MMPLFDMLMRAQNGQAMNDMAAQFGLDLAQMNKVTQALMPAFATGFKRNAASPDAFGQLMQTLASGDYAQYFENAAKAFSPSGIAGGNDVLSQIFGSKDISRAIAAQTEAFTGVGQDIIKQMLPVYASTIMGGMFEQANQAVMDMLGVRQPANPMSPEGSMKIFTDMMRQMMGQPKKQDANPFVEMMNNHPMMKMMNLQPENKAPESALPDNPMADMMQFMFDNMKNAQDAAHKSFEDMLKAADASPNSEPDSDQKSDPTTHSEPDADPAQEPEPDATSHNAEPAAGEDMETQQEQAAGSDSPSVDMSELMSQTMSDMFDKMFETGMAVQDEYKKNIDQIFDQVLTGPRADGPK